MIEAAGGVIWRLADGRTEVLVVHRPRYDDWSFPKGKLEPAEPALDGALREVLEETGLRATVGSRLPDVRYRDRKNRPKRVRYWAMEPSGGKFRANHEVDRITWVPVEDLDDVLTYEHDVILATAFRRILKPVA